MIKNTKLHAKYIDPKPSYKIDVPSLTLSIVMLVFGFRSAVVGLINRYLENSIFLVSLILSE